MEWWQHRRRTMRNTTYEFFSIGGVDPDFKHIWGFETEAERETFLLSHRKKVINSNTFWRPVDHTIKADFSYTAMPSFEASYTYDYVRVTNRSDEAGEQVYYLFIVGRSYINLNLTELVVAIDYIQTYYFVSGVPFWNCPGYCRCWPNRLSKPPLKTITTKTASPTTPRSCAPATATPATHTTTNNDIRSLRNG